MIYSLTSAPQTTNHRPRLITAAPEGWPYVAEDWPFRERRPLSLGDHDVAHAQVMRLAQHLRDTGLSGQAPSVEGLIDRDLTDILTDQISIDLQADITPCREKGREWPPCSWRVRVFGTIFRGKDIEGFTELVSMLLELAEFDATPIRDALSRRQGVEGFDGWS